MIKLIDERNWTYYLTADSDDTLKLGPASLGRISYAIVSHTGEIMKEPEDLEEFFDTVFLGLGKDGSYALFKVDTGDAVYYLAADSLEEFSRARSEPARQRLAVVSVVEQTLSKSRYRFNELLEDYFEKRNSDAKA